MRRLLLCAALAGAVPLVPPAASAPDLRAEADAALRSLRPASEGHAGEAVEGRIAAPWTFKHKGDARVFLASFEVDTRRGVWVDPAAGACGCPQC